ALGAASPGLRRPTGDDEETIRNLAKIHGSWIAKNYWAARNSSTSRKTESNLSLIPMARADAAHTGRRSAEQSRHRCPTRKHKCRGEGAVAIAIRHQCPDQPARADAGAADVPSARPGRSAEPRGFGGRRIRKPDSPPASTAAGRGAGRLGSALR